MYHVVRLTSYVSLCVVSGTRDGTQVIPFQRFLKFGSRDWTVTFYLADSGRCVASGASPDPGAGSRTTFGNLALFNIHLLLLVLFLFLLISITYNNMPSVVVVVRSRSGMKWYEVVVAVVVVILVIIEKGRKKSENKS